MQGEYKIMNIYNITDQMNPNTPLIPLDPNNVQYIVTHHPEAKICTWQDINQWHKEQGWNCGGYNEFIRKNGDVYIMRGMNIGAQCLNYNSKSYGICCEGDYGIETDMPESQKISLIERIRDLKPNFPNFKLVVPHKQFCDTECPGKNFPLVEILKKIEVINVTTAEAMQILADKGVIASPEYWIKVLDTVKNFDQLIINMAQKLK